MFFEFIYLKPFEYFVTKVPAEEVAAKISVVVECDTAVAVVNCAFLAAQSSGCH